MSFFDISSNCKVTLIDSLNEFFNDFSNSSYGCESYLSQVYEREIHEDIFIPKSKCSEEELKRMGCNETILGFPKGARK